MILIFQLIVIGFFMRVVVWALLITMTPVKKPITLHPVFGILAVAHYALANEYYVQYDFINVWSVLGFVIPELSKIIKLRSV